jgi:hypothetical protein
MIKKPKNIFGEILGQNLPLSANKAMKRELIITPTEFDKKSSFLLISKFA